jgi:hypothetical protein
MEGIVIVHWHGQPTPACPKHLQRLLALAGIMGFQLSCTPAINGEICTNCVNELKREMECASPIK